MPFEIPENIHPNCAPLAWLLGGWRGNGEGDYPTIEKFTWGQELISFEQNTGSRGIITPGTKVDVSWRPEFAFLLDASQDVNAGIEEE